MLAGILGGFTALYVVAWIVLIAMAHSEYMRTGARSDGNMLLAAVFCGPLALVIDIPKLTVTVVRLIKERVGG